MHIEYDKNSSPKKISLFKEDFSEKMPIQNEELPNDEKLLNFKIIGDGKPVLCISGFACDHYNYLDLASYTLFNHQMILVDNRGVGESFKTIKPFSLKDLAQDALKVMDHLGHNTFSVAGISMGGLIAQELVQLAPHRVETLSLYCITGFGEDFIPIPIHTDESLEAFHKMDIQSALTMAIDLTCHPETSQNTKNHILQTRLQHLEGVVISKLQRDAVVDFFKNAHINYKTISCPTLIVTGEEDRFVSPKNSLVLHENIENSELYFIPKTDHYFFMEKPNVLAQIFNKFLKNNKKQPLGANHANWSN